VENQRADLRARGETQSFRMIENYLHAVIGLSDPDANENQAAQQMQAGQQQLIRETVGAINAFQANMQRTKPPVPADCGALDRFYSAAAIREAVATRDLLVAMGSNDIGRIKMIGHSAVNDINADLGRANNELEKVYRGRGLNQLFKIDAGGGSSMLDGLSGLGGMR
jgi:hypothetical protein